MNRLHVLFILVALVLGIGWGTPQTARGNPVEIIHVPRGDISPFIGDEEEGAWTSLADVRALGGARRHSNASDPGAGPVSIESIRLEGDLTRLRMSEVFLDVQISWKAETQEDHAVLVANDVAWFGQQRVPGNVAILSRGDGATTWLVCTGNSAGVLKARRRARVSMAENTFEVRLLGLNAPASTRLKVPTGWTPKMPDDQTGEALLAFDEGQGVLTVWQQTGQSAIVRFVRNLDVESTNASSITMERVLRPAGDAVVVEDTLVLASRDPRTSWTLNLPEGMQLIQVEPLGDASARINADGMQVRPVNGRAAVRVLLLLPLKDRRAVANPWRVPPGVVWHRARMGFEDRKAGVVTPQWIRPEGSTWVPGRRDESMEALGEPEPADVLCFPAKRDEAITVAGRLEVASSHLRAEYELSEGGTVSPQLPFEAPLGWRVSLVAADGPASGWLIDRGNGAYLLVRKPGVQAPLRIELQAAGAVRDADRAEPAPLPLLRFPDRRVGSYRLEVHWPESIEARIEPGTGVQVRPAMGKESGFAAARLDVQAEDPAASVTLLRRVADVRATISTRVALGEDRTRVRIQAAFDVGIAPARRVRLLLPAGTARDVRVDDAGLRESTVESGPEGDLWTFEFSDATMGSRTIGLDWAAPPVASGGSFEVPRVLAPGATTQVGFVGVEGAESMRLEFESSNLAEVDAAELPAAGWGGEQRVIGAWRWASPRYRLRIGVEKFQAERGLAANASAATLVSAVDADGGTYTKATYQVELFTDRQFLEVQLPKGAVLWSATVNGLGAKPSRRVEAGGVVHLLPLPQAREDRRVTVSVVYREDIGAFESGRTWRIDPPRLPIPVNQTRWEVTLPDGYRHLAFRGMDDAPTGGDQALITYFRTAYYPRYILIEGPGATLLKLSGYLFLALGVLYGIVRYGTRLSGAVLKRVAEWLVVVLIVLILSAIAVPNFLEAQSRSKVSRARSDLRSMATGIESYMTDYGIAPPDSRVLWEGPVKYLTAPFADPFAGSESSSYGYRGSSSQQALRYATGESLRSMIGTPADRGIDWRREWIVWSVGPDGRDDEGRITYDPTNGAVSPGDVWRASEGIVARMHDSSAPIDVQVVPASAPVVTGADSNREVAAARAQRGRKPGEPAPPAPATVFPQAEGAAKQAMTELASSSSGQSDARGEESRGTLHDGPPDLISPTMGDGADFDGDGQMEVIGAGAGRLDSGGLGGGTTPVAGLLSLRVEVPTGNRALVFASTADAPFIEGDTVRESRFRAMNFLAALLAFVVGAFVALMLPKLYRGVVVVLIAAALTMPLMVPSVWIALCNSAFYGAALTVVVALVHRIRPGRGSVRAAGAGAVLVAALLAPSGVPAAEPDSAASEPIRVIVPYGPDEYPGLNPNAAAFLRRADFERLYRAANPDAGHGRGSRNWGTVLDQVRLQLEVNPERRRAVGQLVVGAVNTTDAASSATLVLSPLITQGIRSEPPGAFATFEDMGRIRIHTPANWAGEMTFEVETPIAISGREGRFELSANGIHVGLVELRVPGSIESATEAAPDENGQTTTQPITALEDSNASVLRTGLSDGRRLLTWRAALASRDTPPKSALLTAGMTLRVDRLNFARWETELRLAPDAGEVAVPAEVRVAVDGAFDLQNAEGQGLVRVRRDGDSLVLGFDGNAPSRSVRLSALVPPMAGDATQFRVPRIVDSRGTRIAVQVVSPLVVLRTAPTGLGRDGAGPPAGDDVETQSWRAGAGEWSLELGVGIEPSRERFALRTVAVPSPGGLSALTLVESTGEASAGGLRIFRLPDSARVDAVTGPAVEGWLAAESDGTLTVLCDPGRRQPLEIRWSLPAKSAEVHRLALIEIAAGGTDSQRLVVASLGDTEVLDERDPQTRSVELSDSDRSLAVALIGEEQMAETVLRAWEVESGGALRFRVIDSGASSSTVASTIVTLRDGVQSIEGVLSARPRRGRLTRIEGRIVLPESDPGLPSRVSVRAPAGETRIEPDGPKSWVLRHTLLVPEPGEVRIAVSFDWPTDTANGASITPPVLASPSGAAAERAFFVLRRAIAGELTTAPRAGVKRLDGPPASWPTAMLPVALGDEVFEFTGDGPPASTLSLHARESGLAAIAESLRERVIVSSDGTERRELEIALQNESEQFLRIDLAHPRNQVTVHQVQVAGRDVRIAWERHDGRDLLLVPLIRTGLLEPEVAIRVAWVARGSALGVAGNREFRLSGLRDVPVSQSSMILMVPREYNWSGIEGTLEQVEVLDLELDETARQARNLKKLAEAVETTKGEVQVQALSKLGALNQAYEQKVTVLKKDVQALSRAEDSSTDEQRRSRAAANEKARQQVIDEVDMTLRSNVNLVQQTTVNQTQSAVALTVTDPRVEFPRIGGTLAFRQQQGIGSVRLDFVAVERVQRRNDVMMAMLLITALLAGVTLGNSLFRTRRRAALVMALAAGGAMWLGAAVDLAVVVILVAVVLAVLGRRTGETSTPVEAMD